MVFGYSSYNLKTIYTIQANDLQTSYSSPNPNPIPTHCNRIRQDGQQRFPVRGTVAPSPSGRTPSESLRSYIIYKNLAKGRMDKNKHLDMNKHNGRAETIITPASTSTQFFCVDGPLCKKPGFINFRGLTLRLAFGLVLKTRVRSYGKCPNKSYT